MAYFDTYVVGGAVRDVLLGLEPKDLDYVVVGASPEDMLTRGYKQVGADFPVFLHPETGDEYALARTERKTGKGYHGFATDFGTHVTLEDDLRRRDLTMNAMAVRVVDWDLFKLATSMLRDLSPGSEAWRFLIDPFNGAQDLRLKVLRHVSPAFAEDPLRVLRVARFAARYGFTVHFDTLALCKELVHAGELDAVSIERFWKETDRALDEFYAWMYIEMLDQVDALERVKFFSEGFDREKLYDCIACDGPLPKKLTYAVAGKFGTMDGKKAAWLKVSNDVMKLAQTVAAAKRLHEDGAFKGDVAKVSAFVRTLSDELVEEVRECLNHELGVKGKLLGFFVRDLWLAFQHVKASDIMAADPTLEGKAIGDAVEAARRERMTYVMKACPA